MADKLRTKWYRIAVVGDSIDGRVITEKEITELAETYSQKFYGALIWPDHYRGYANHGQVIALKKEVINEDGNPLNGSLALYAILAPNQYLIELNGRGQKIYTSIEIWPDFRNSGKCYLAGLAVTDQPGSVGTEALKFSIKSQPEMFISKPTDFGLSDLINNIGEQPEENFNFTPTDKDKPKMNEDQLKQFLDAQKTQTQAITVMGEAFKAFIANPETTPKPKAGNETPDADKGGAEEFVSKKDFEVVTKSLETVTKSLEKVSTDFAAAMGEEFNATDVDGDGEEAGATF